VRMVTLAPELPHSLDLIRSLQSRSIVVAAGHSLATYAEMEAAVKAGVTLGTHLYNAMGSLHARDPGLVGYLLSHSGFPYSIIADGVHVSPKMLQIAWKANPEGLFLVTDAIEAQGGPEGSYHLGDSRVVVNGGKALIEGTQTLAGSLLTMDQAVRNLCTFTGCSIVEALEAASLKPARILGIEKQKGTLEPGADADLIFLDDQLRILETTVGASFNF
jgi:N-acetylglucosamine-6-phosphate deacetylase